MAAFAAVYVACLRRLQSFRHRKRLLHLAVGFYGVQRFRLEFIKPYGAAIGPLTLFHILSALLAAYAIAHDRHSATSRELSMTRAFA